MFSWRDEIDLVCLEAFDSIEAAQLAARCLQDAQVNMLSLMGLPEDTFDRIDDVLGES